MQKTLSILKPDAVKRNILGQVIAKIEQAKLKVVAQKMLHLSANQARDFYYVHKDRNFFESLVQYMISGPVVVQVLAGDNAIYEYRKIMGATDPKDAAQGTIRAEFGLSIEENTVHGSDSEENADFEISFFFADFEIFTSTAR
ncbi:nucleoside diphosphate kinase [Rickettsiales bacterium]|nr:nucleoside diphosphate kinase [Rickettsiales bacterium]